MATLCTFLVFSWAPMKLGGGPFSASVALRKPRVYTVLKDWSALNGVEAPSTARLSFG